MKTRAQISMAVLAVAVGVLACPIASGKTKGANQAQQLEKLLKERQAILRQQGPPCPEGRGESSGTERCG